MTEPESGDSPPWNAEVAAVLFAEFARMQVEGGIFAEYLRIARRFMEDDPGSAELVQRVLYIELPLGVSVEPEFDNESSGRLDLYLIKVNPSNGRTIQESAFYTGYILDPESGELSVSYSEENFDSYSELSIEQAMLLREQYRLQQANGLIVR